MRELRDAHGAERLGKHVRANISAELHGQGLSHVPAEELPDYHAAEVLLYKQGTRAAEIIEAVLAPSGKSAETIRDAAQSDAESKLKRIRELLD
jgi:hypothetical protein